MNKFLSTLGLARRANKLVYGFDSVTESHGVSLVFLSNDLSERTRRTALAIFEQKNIQTVSLNYTKNELGYAIGTKPVGIIGITDNGFAELLIKQNI